MTTSITVWAQDDAGQTPDNQYPAPPTASSLEVEPPAAAPAYETHPDILPTLDQRQGEVSERRSFFIAGIHIGENAEGDSSQLTSITNLFGNLSFLSVRRRSETAIDYLGGAEVSNNQGFLGSSSVQVQQLTAEHHMLWRRRDLTFFDKFGDLPGGDFGSAWFGGAGLYNLGIEGVDANRPTPSNLSNFFGSTDFGGFGGAYYSNVSLVEDQELLSRRSTLTAIGGYGLTDYSGSQGLINSRIIGAQVRYSYRLNPRNQVGFSFGLRNLRFPEPGAGNINTNSVQMMFGRQLASRVNFAIAVGPEFVTLSGSSSGSKKQIGGGGNVSLTYLLRKGRVTLGCDRMVTTGSGLYAGANTDDCRLSVTRQRRRWSISLDGGYARLVPIGQSLLGNLTQGYEYTFVGAALNRELGQHFGAFAGYQFNNQSLGNSLCTVSGACSQIGQNIISVGIDLRTRPKRLE